MSKRRFSLARVFKNPQPKSPKAKHESTDPRRQQCDCAFRYYKGRRVMFREDYEKLRAKVLSRKYN